MAKRAYLLVKHRDRCQRQVKILQIETSKESSVSIFILDDLTGRLMYDSR